MTIKNVPQPRDRLKPERLRQLGQLQVIMANTFCTDVLQLSGRLAGDVKESPNGNPTRDLQMAADRTRPHSAAMLADSLAGENPARGTCPVATVVISGDGAGD